MVLENTFCCRSSRRRLVVDVRMAMSVMDHQLGLDTVVRRRTSSSWKGDDWDRSFLALGPLMFLDPYRSRLRRSYWSGCG